MRIAKLIILLLTSFLIACEKQIIVEEDEDYDIEYDMSDLASTVVSNPSRESVAHGSYIVASKYDNSFYITYYSGEHAEIEFIYKTDINVKLVKVSTKTLTIEKSCTVLDKGEKVGAFTQSLTDSPYDPCLYEFPRYIRVWMVVSPQGGKFMSSRAIGFRDIMKDGFKPSDTITVCKLIYKAGGKEYCDEMNVANLNLFADRIRGVPGHDVGEYPVFNGVKEINGSLYTVLSFISTKTNVSIAPCLLKSDDGGATWDYEGGIYGQYDMSRFWEVGWDYDRGMIYIVSRSCDSNDMPSFEYSLSTDVWSEMPSLFAGDVDDSRPALMCRKDDLIVLQNVFPRVDNGGIRSRVRLARVSHDFDVISLTDITAPFGCSYFSMVECGGQFFLLSTEDYRRTAPGNKGDIVLINISDVIKRLY